MKINAKRTVRSPLGFLLVVIVKHHLRRHEPNSVRRFFNLQNEMKILVTLLIAVGTFGGIASGAVQTKDSLPGGNTAPATIAGPKIQFAETVHDFGKVTSGDVVRHDFVFTNLGTATLEIKDVRPGCGCTTAGNWDKLVEPGKTGAIPLQFNSAGFGGTVTKSAAVICNDPGLTNVHLQLTGTVWKPIIATPTMAMFTVSTEAQSSETKVVRIVSDLEEPIELSDLQCTNRAFRAELKTVKEGKEFELAITAVPPFVSSRILAPVTLKTSSAKMPVVTVSAYVIVPEPVVVEPNQIMLPVGPLTAAVSRTITIRNSGTNSLALSDASVNVPGAEVRVQETQPGRLFSVTVSLPAGFETNPDQKVAMTVKSNHPKYSLITVPVIAAGPIAASPVRVTPAPVAVVR